MWPEEWKGAHVVLMGAWIRKTQRSIRRLRENGCYFSEQSVRGLKDAAAKVKAMPRMDGRPKHEREC